MRRNGFGAVRKLPSGRYQASYIGRDGARHSGTTTFSHRDDAFAWLSKERRLFEEGSSWSPPAQRAEEEAAAVLKAAVVPPRVAGPVHQGEGDQIATSAEGNNRGQLPHPGAAHDQWH